MGRMYVSEKLMPALKLLQKAYTLGTINAEEAYHMAYGMAYHKEETEREEEVSPHTPFREEEKDKEEKLSLSTREALFSSSSKTQRSGKGDALRRATTEGNDPFPPTAEEVQAYLDEIGEKRFSGNDFCDYYEGEGWQTKSGRLLQNWKAKARNWRKLEKRNVLINETNVTQKQTQGAATDAPTAAESRSREEQLEAHLASHYLDNVEVAWLARQIAALAQAMEVPDDTYGAVQIAFDAQFFTTFEFYRGWRRERWQEALRYVKEHAERLNSDAMRGMVFEYRQKGQRPHP